MPCSRRADLLQFPKVQLGNYSTTANLPHLCELSLLPLLRSLSKLKSPLLEFHFSPNTFFHFEGKEDIVHKFQLGMVRKPLTTTQYLEVIQCTYTEILMDKNFACKILKWYHIYFQTNSIMCHSIQREELKCSNWQFNLQY